MSAYHWLVAQGLYRDLVSAGILVPIMHIVAGRPLRRAARALESGARDVARDVAQDVAWPETHNIWTGKDK